MKRPKRWLILSSLSMTLAAALTAFACLGSPAHTRDDEGVLRSSMQVNDDLTVSYLHGGDPDAPRIIYVHGSPGDARAWIHYVKDPIPGFESIAIDRLGFGQTEPNGPVPSLEEQAKAIEPFLVERHGRWPILVGHSLGGTIVCRAAADYPDRVGGLVVVSGALDPKLEKVHWYQRLGEFWVIPRLLPEAVRNANRELTPLRGELETLEPLLKCIVCPVIIVQGKNDWLVSPENVDYLKKALPSDNPPNVILLRKGNHFLPWNAADTIRQAIRDLGDLPTPS